MSNITRKLLRKLMSEHKYDQVSLTSKIIYPDQNLVVHEYAGDYPRLMKRGDTTYILCPKKISTIQECGVADAIEKGTIFYDAEDVDRHADYLEKITLPITAIVNKFGIEPTKLRIVISGVIGRIGDDGSVELTPMDMNNGHDFLHEIMHSRGCDEIRGTCDHYMGLDKNDPEDHMSLPKDIKRDITALIKEIDSITDIDPDDEITPDDFELIGLSDDDDYDDEDTEDYDDEDREDDDDDDDISDDEDDDDIVDESYIMEDFRTKHPKKLKPIPRDVVAYITVEINAIRDENDQAMIAGYTSAKLELVDFYLNCIDTNDPRYVVPHTRQYLVQMQKELDDLLKRILQIRPVDRMGRVWRGVL